MMKMLRKSRGFVMLAVIGILAIVLIYLVTVQGAIGFTVSQARVAAQQQDSAQAMAALVSQALASHQVPGAPQMLTPPGGETGSARVTRTPLPAGHELWQSLPLLKPQAGDELVSIEMKLGGNTLQGRFIVNRQGLRPGVITLENGVVARAARP